MSVKLSEIKPINGYVLIKADPHYETYQFAGNETGILVSNHSYMNHQGKQVAIDVKERNYSVRATVVAVPKNLNVPDDKYHRIDRGLVKEGKNKGMVENFSCSEAFRKYSEKVNNYDTDMEIEVGDRIFVSWKAHKDGDIIQTEEGEFVFIKYDQIVMTLDEKDNPKKMVNGWVLFTADENKEVKKDGGLEYKTTDSGIFLPVMSDKSKEVRKKKNFICTAYLAGKPNKGYKDFKGERDEEYDIAKGEKLLINRRGARLLENSNHRELKEKFYITHRKFIIFTKSNAESQGIDFEKLIE